MKHLKNARSMLALGWVYVFILVTWVVSCSEPLNEVEFHSIYGTVVVSDTHIAIPGVIVTLDNNSVVSDSNGLFVFPDVTSGTYQLSISGEDYLPYSRVVHTAADAGTPISIGLTYTDAAEPRFFIRLESATGFGIPALPVTLRLGTQDTTRISDASGLLSIPISEIGDNSLTVSCNSSIFYFAPREFARPLSTALLDRVIVVDILDISSSEIINNTITKDSGKLLLEWSSPSSAHISAYKVYARKRHFYLDMENHINDYQYIWPDPWSCIYEGEEPSTDYALLDDYNYQFEFCILPINLAGAISGSTIEVVASYSLPQNYTAHRNYTGWSNGTVFGLGGELPDLPGEDLYLVVNWTYQVRNYINYSEGWKIMSSGSDSMDGAQLVASNTWPKSEGTYTYQSHDADLLDIIPINEHKGTSLWIQTQIGAYTVIKSILIFGVTNND